MNHTKFRLDVPDVQAYLSDAGLDGWLIYDFWGQNRVAQALIDLTEHHFTRRWFYYIPQRGEPCLLVHKIEDVIFPSVPGERRLYAGREELQTALIEMLRGANKIAMEYSPMCAIPTVSFVDAGTLEIVRGCGPEVKSSANLVQYFTCRLSHEQLQSHITAVKILHEAQEQAFGLIGERLRRGETITEYDVQQFIRERIYGNGLVSMSDAIVAVNGNASNPHYSPTAATFTEIRKGDCILIDLWAKEDKPGAVYGDITWSGFAGTSPPAQYVEIWEAGKGGRDAGVALLRENHKNGVLTQGFQVDEAVRDYITAKGYGDYFFHRTGHSIDQEDHGKGVNIDSYETNDLREIIPGLLFSIEPGVYLPEFGIRTEIDVYYGENGPEIFAPVQEDLVLMDV